jgi:hypothetical protein
MHVVSCHVVQLVHDMPQLVFGTVFAHDCSLEGAVIFTAPLAHVPGTPFLDFP